MNVPKTHNIFVSNMNVDEFLQNKIPGGYKDGVSINIIPPGKTLEWDAAGNCHNYGTLSIDYSDWQNPKFTFYSDCEKEDRDTIFSCAKRAVDEVMNNTRPDFKNTPKVAEGHIGSEAFGYTEFNQPTRTLSNSVIAQLVSRIKMHGYKTSIDAKYVEVPEEIAGNTGIPEIKMNITPELELQKTYTLVVNGLTTDQLLKSRIPNIHFDEGFIHFGKSSKMISIASHQNSNSSSIFSVTKDMEGALTEVMLDVTGGTGIMYPDVGGIKFNKGVTDYQLAEIAEKLGGYRGISVWFKQVPEEVILNSGLPEANMDLYDAAKRAYWVFNGEIVPVEDEEPA